MKKLFLILHYHRNETGHLKKKDHWILFRLHDTMHKSQNLLVGTDVNTFLALTTSTCPEQPEKSSSYIPQSLPLLHWRWVASFYQVSTHFQSPVISRLPWAKASYVSQVCWALPCLADYFSLLQAAEDTNKRTPCKFKRFHSYEIEQTTHLRFIWGVVDLNPYVEVTYHQDYWKWMSHEGSLIKKHYTYLLLCLVLRLSERQ